MTENPRAVRLSSFQVAEIALFVVIQAVALLLQATGLQVVGAVLMVAELAILVHIATWLVPMVRARLDRRS